LTYLRWPPHVSFSIIRKPGVALTKRRSVCSDSGKPVMSRKELNKRRDMINSFSFEYKFIMYIKNFSAFSAKVDYGRSKQALHYNQRPCRPDYNVSVIGQRWNYPSNEKIIDFVQESICYANQINT
ncbi:hypothetical protein HID58_037654, partial [Brassica napus]